MSPAAQTAPTHARRTYVPQENREGVALCLSGGGFRASLFHLGATRRLNELGVLDEVTTIVAVSGGSMFAAFLAARCSEWFGKKLTAEAWEATISEPFRRFASSDLNAIPFLIGWLPWNWRNNAGVEALARACQRRGLTNQTTLSLPDKPRFLFEATNLVSGTEWIFQHSDDKPPQEIALAVAISSCYPGFFRPYTKARPERISLADGGIDDNRGVEPVWQTHEWLLVSDGGDVLRPQWGESILWSLVRASRVLWNQSQAVHKRWLISNFISKQMKGTYWDIEGSPVHYLQESGRERFQGYTPELARDVISQIRTEYDAFSHAEAAVLENHGYFLADAAASAHLEIENPPPLRVPHPGWMNEAEIRLALRNSGRKRYFPRRRSFK